MGLTIKLDLQMVKVYQRAEFTRRSNAISSKKVITRRETNRQTTVRVQYLESLNTKVVGSNCYQLQTAGTFNAATLRYMQCYLSKVQFTTAKTSDAV